MTINIKRVGNNTLLDFNALAQAKPTKTEPRFGQIGWLRGLDFNHPLAYIAAQGAQQTGQYFYAPTTQPTCTKRLKTKQYKAYTTLELQQAVVDYALYAR